MLYFTSFLITSSLFFDSNENIGNYLKYSSYVYLATPVYAYKVDKNPTVFYDSLGDNLDNKLLKISANFDQINKVYYVFKIDEAILGEEVNHLTLSFYYDSFDTCKLDKNFNDHSDQEFWTTKAGRSVEKNFPETHYIFSCFEKDKTYLLLSHQGFGKKKYELIESENDKWLEYIKTQVSTLKSNK
ncbi:hypothetical protein [Marinicella sp. W31]|uniref:hypothetical protein n=1 Tax=Marinicella sp. W31 TaxID=3023713 RepID=UPI003757EE3B